MIRAQLVRALSDDLSSMKLETLEAAPLVAGSVRVRLRAASVNFPDILMIQGKYQYKPELPFTPGMEGAGEIVECGSGVSGFSVGDKVVVGSKIGCFAEEITSLLPVIYEGKYGDNTCFQLFTPTGNFLTLAGFIGC